MPKELALDFYRKENYKHCERLINPGRLVKVRKHSIDFRLLPINLCGMSEALWNSQIFYLCIPKRNIIKDNLNPFLRVT